MSGKTATITAVIRTLRESQGAGQHGAWPSTDARCANVSGGSTPAHASEPWREVGVSTGGLGRCGPLGREGSSKSVGKRGWWVEVEVKVGKRWW